MSRKRRGTPPHRLAQAGTGGSVLVGKNPFLIALALGLAASAVSWSAIRARQRRDHQGWDVVRILCAEQDIPEGTELDRAMVSARDIPARFVTGSFIRADGEGQWRGAPPPPPRATRRGRSPCWRTWWSPPPATSTPPPATCPRRTSATRR